MLETYALAWGLGPPHMGVRSVYFFNKLKTGPEVPGSDDN